MRHISFIIAVFFVLSAVSCVRKSGSGILSYQESLTGAEVTVTGGVSEYSAHVTLGAPLKDGAYRNSEIEITSPAEIAGVRISFGGDGAQIHCGEISSPLAAGTADGVYRIIRAFSLDESELRGAGDGLSGDGSSRSFIFECGEGEESVQYDLTLSEDGLPSGVVIGDGEGSVRVTFTALFMEGTDSSDESRTASQNHE